jgi:hypothetical protein
MLLGGEGHQSVIYGTPAMPRRLKVTWTFRAVGPLSVSGVVNRVSSRRAASSAESLASPGNLVSTE